MSATISSKSSPRSLVVVGTSTFAARARVAIGTAAASATALSFVDNGSARRSPPFPPRRAVAFGDAERADARNRGAAAAVSTRRESWTGAGGTAASPPANDQRRSRIIVFLMLLRAIAKVRGETFLPTSTLGLWLTVAPSVTRHEILRIGGTWSSVNFVNRDCCRRTQSPTLITRERCEWERVKR